MCILFSREQVDGLDIAFPSFSKIPCPRIDRIICVIQRRHLMTTDTSM